MKGDSRVIDGWHVPYPQDCPNWTRISPSVAIKIIHKYPWRQGSKTEWTEELNDY